MTTATATSKTAYTAEQTTKMIGEYTALPTADTVEALAKEFGKTVKSVVAKLSREGVYKKKEYVSKSGEKPIKKDELANEFETLFNLTEAEADSLTKANKTALAKILNSYKAMKAE